MNDLTDLQLVQKFQINDNNKIKDEVFLELFTRYKGFLIKKANTITLQNSFYPFNVSTSFDDVFQEMKIALFKAIEYVNVSKLYNAKTKKYNHICMSLLINNYINNYKQKLYSKQTTENNSIVPDSMRNRLFVKIYHEETYTDIISKFYTYLNTKENIVFKEYMKGKKQYDIARQLNVSPQQINYNMKKIRKKYINFCDEN